MGVRAGGEPTRRRPDADSTDTGVRARAELCRAQAQYQALAGQQAVGVLYVGGDLRVRDALVDPEAFGGLAASAGVRMTDLLAEDDRQDAAACLEAVLDTGSPPAPAARHRTWALAGTRELLHVAATVLRGGDGLVVVLISILDSARRRERGRRPSFDLQQSRIPPPSVHMAGVDAAGRYLPIASTGLGGDWYDVIPLPGAQAALVVGDVVGHGRGAVGMMVRLRTAVQTFAHEGLPPDELLARLDALVARIDEEDGLRTSPLGSTCLYLVYDPVAHCCSIAGAGHPPPLLLGPDGGAAPVGISPGPLLGVGGHPFEVTEITVEPGSVLALISDGLIQHPDMDIGIKTLLDRLTGCGPAAAPGAIADRLMEGTAPGRDDRTVLVARLRSLPPRCSAR